MPPHVCSEHCVCPDHGTPLIWWPHGEMHACQDVDCRYGRGLEPVRYQETLVQIAERWARTGPLDDTTRPTARGSEDFSLTFDEMALIMARLNTTPKGN